MDVRPAETVNVSPRALHYAGGRPRRTVREHKGSHQLHLGVARHVHAAQRLLLRLGRRREGLDTAPRVLRVYR